MKRKAKVNPIHFKTNYTDHTNHTDHTDANRSVGRRESTVKHDTVNTPKLGSNNSVKITR